MSSTNSGKVWPCTSPGSMRFSTSSGKGRPIQSNKNPCSVTVLICGNLNTLIDFCKKIQPNLCCFVAKMPPNRAILLQKFKKKLRCFVTKFSQKIYVVLFDHFHKQLLSSKISTTNLLCDKTSTKLCFVGKFPHKFALLENFHKQLI